MNKKEIEARLVQLCAERDRLGRDLETARADATRAVIEGREPGTEAAGLAERIATVDAATVELEARLHAAEESADRRRRTLRAESALQAATHRAELAQAVDDALARLADAWPAYVDALRKDVGAAAGAGAELNAVERALTDRRAAEPLVKALIHAGGAHLARALGIQTAIRDRHAIPLAGAEGRVAESLRLALLRVRADSPQPNVAREAAREIKGMTS